MQIHRQIASGEDVVGWLLPEKELACRDVIGHNRDPGSDLIELCDITVFNKVLGKAIEFPPPTRIFNADEKPITPDNPSLRRIGDAVGYGRTSQWTVMPFINAQGQLISYTIILRGQSVPTELEAFSNRLKESYKVNFSLIATEKGCQTDQSLFNELERFIQIVKPTRRDPVLLLLDGHSSRLTSQVQNLLLENNVYCLIFPSQTSCMLQPLDNGPNAHIENYYMHEYDARVVKKPSIPLKNKHRVKLLVRTMCKLPKNEQAIRRAWKVVGLPLGVPT